MKFSEAYGAWQEIPQWGEFLVRFGFAWLGCDSGTRRIGLISMPCDSAAAGLVALGAMRRRLEFDSASDLISHFQRIETLALHGDVQTLLFCRQERGRRRGPYVLDGQFSPGMLWARLTSSPDERRTISPATAADWQFGGEAPVQVLDGERVPYRDVYAVLVKNGQPIVESKLVQSDSGICLAGRVAGESATHSILATIRFQANGCIANLSELLTVQSWSPGTISRVSFFNPRTGQIDRNTSLHRLVVVDGDSSFLKVVERAEFRQSDVVGVIHRTVEREKLEELGLKLASLGQWYGPDAEMLSGLPLPPSGIAVSILRRR